MTNNHHSLSCYYVQDTVPGVLPSFPCGNLTLASKKRPRDPSRWHNQQVTGHKLTSSDLLDFRPASPQNTWLPTLSINHGDIGRAKCSQRPMGYQSHQGAITQINPASNSMEKHSQKGTPDWLARQAFMHGVHTQAPMYWIKHTVPRHLLCGRHITCIASYSENTNSSAFMFQSCVQLLNKHKNRTNGQKLFFWSFSNKKNFG